MQHANFLGCNPRRLTQVSPTLSEINLPFKRLRYCEARLLSVSLEPLQELRNEVHYLHGYLTKVKTSKGQDVAQRSLNNAVSRLVEQIK